MTIEHKENPSIEELQFQGDTYHTGSNSSSFLSRTFPSFSFYSRFMSIVWKSSRLAKHGNYDNFEWVASSKNIVSLLERSGVEIEISGLDNLRDMDTPCVFIGNHMSMLETMVLPCIIEPFLHVTFVIKQSLLEYPAFKHTMRSRAPIAITRTNPKEDFKTVMSGGQDRLKNGTSIIIFPQTTRMIEFNPDQFNSIGIKLAKRTKAPIIPIALRTDAWSNGKILKDFGPIRPKRKVHFAFGKPMTVDGRGDAEHQSIIDFIQTKLSEWT